MLYNKTKFGRLMDLSLIMGERVSVLMERYNLIKNKTLEGMICQCQVSVVLAMCQAGLNTLCLLII